MEQDATRDEPSPLDLTRDELFGGDFSLPKPMPTIVDHRPKATIYSQGLLAESHMACWSYGMRHIINLIERLAGDKDEINPIDDWRLFYPAHKTKDYNPLEKWSSMQAQLDFATKKWRINGYYKVTTVQEMKEAINKHNFIYTGSKKIDRKKTRDSKDKVVVVGEWPWHIIELDGFDDEKKLFYMRNSYGRKAYDNGYMYLKYEDIGCLFSMYAVIDKHDGTLKDRIKARIAKKKETMRYGVKIVNGKKKLGRRPK